MLDLLIISQACFTAINRGIYRQLLKEGWKLELVIPQTLNFPSGSKNADPAMPGDPSIHFLSLEGINPRIYLFKGLMSLLEEKKPSVVLLDNDPVSRLALLTGKWCVRHNAKLFCISCENLPLSLVNTIKRRGWKALPAAIFKRMLLYRTRKTVEGVFTINLDGKKIFLQEGYNKVEHMPLGFDPAYFFEDQRGRAEIRKKLGLHKTVIAYFGRLIQEKGIHILIQSLRNLKHCEWLFMMDEFDEYASDYNIEINRLLSEAGIIDRVIFVRPDHFHIAAYMNAADIIVVPSVTTTAWKEQYGRVAAEGMACGKMVVASNSGALPELLGNYGMLFPEGDIVALAAMLEKLISQSNHDFPSSGEIASYARKQLSMIRQKEIMESVFETAMGNKHALLENG